MFVMGNKKPLAVINGNIIINKMEKKGTQEKLIMGLDVSTKTIGIALFEVTGKLLELTHISPKIKPEPENKHVEMMLKSDIFKQYIGKYRGMGLKAGAAMGFSTISPNIGIPRANLSKNSAAVPSNGFIPTPNLCILCTYCGRAC